MIRSFLLDQHLGEIWRILLLRADPDLIVERVGEIGCPIYGTLDPEILIWLEENERILITCNRQSMPTHLAAHLASARHIPGILTTPEQLPSHAIIDNIILAVGAGFAEEFRDQNRYLPIQ